MGQKRKLVMVYGLVFSLIAALATIILQDDLREKLGDTYYVIGLSIIGCVLLVLTGYVWDRALWSRIKALGVKADSIKLNSDSPFEISPQPLTDPDQDEIIGLAQRIERMARSMQRVDANYRGIVEDQFDLICRYLPDGRLTFVNGAYCRFYHAKRSDLIGQQFTGLASSSPLPWTDNPAIQTYEQEIIAKGKITWLQWAVREIRDPDNKLSEYQAVGHDITARKTSENALHDAKEAAESANRAKGEFLAIVSHEIRTPISGVLGFADILNETSLNAEQREYVQLIQKSGEALLLLINDLLDIEKIEAGKIELESEPFSPRRCIEEVVDFFSPKARLSNLKIEAQIPPDLPPFVIGDIYRLRQILINLVGNSVKFTSSGSVTVSVEAVPLDSHAQNAVLRFCVSDTGVGIPPEKIAALFKPFSQVGASTSRTYGGTGLGLSICKRLCELMGGNISVESTPGAGSKFIFTVRCKLAPRAA
ncbi:ATP-binding protein [Oleiharenicola lentus]|uniref:PAS domain-containing protein n=1 Tax=Oleiharenicola lentus TaxID=2508720 RepID=UPI003F67C099